MTKRKITHNFCKILSFKIKHKKIGMEPYISKTKLEILLTKKVFFILVTLKIFLYKSK